MSSSKRERETPEYMPSEEEYKSEASEPTTPKKKSKTTPHSSPTKCKTEGGEKPRSWTAEENAIITRGVQALITTHQPDYSTILPELEAANGGYVRSKNAVQQHWSKVLKQQLLASISFTPQSKKSK